MFLARFHYWHFIYFYSNLNINLPKELLQNNVICDSYFDLKKIIVRLDLTIKHLEFALKYSRLLLCFQKFVHNDCENEAKNLFLTLKVN